MTGENATGHETPSRGPLSGLRVVELADEKGEFCGKLMADLGADVVKVEPPGGQATRLVGPFLDDLPHPERSLYFWHYNTSKRGVTLDISASDGQAVLRRLAATADVVLETHRPGYLDSLGLGYDALVRLNAGIVMCSLTPFGQTGPWCDYRTSDLLHLAAGGQMASCGYDPEDVPDAPPIAPGGGNAWHMGGHYAFMAILAALHWRHVTGHGQYIDASVHDACALTTEAAVTMYVHTGKVMRRHTGRAASPGPSPRTQIEARDGGWVQTTGFLTYGSPARLRGLTEWMDRHGLAGDLLEDRYMDPRVLDQEAGHVSEVIADFIASLPREEAWHGGQARAYPWGAVRTLDEIVRDPHLADRGFFTQVDHPELGRAFTYPGPAALFSDSPWRISRRAPLVGEHNVEIFCGELGLSGDELHALAAAGVV